MEDVDRDALMLRAAAASAQDSEEVARARIEAARIAAEEADAAEELTKLPCFRKPLPQSLSDIPNFMEKVRDLLEYEAETGLLRYAFIPADPHRLNLNNIATSPYGPNGYGRVRLWDFGTSSANVVWLLHHGRWPFGRLRRRDGDVKNDRIENLYEAEPKGEPTGRKPSRGVARSGPYHWQAYTKIRGVQKNLGRFSTEAEAIAARAAWDRGEDLV